MLQIALFLSVVTGCSASANSTIAPVAGKPETVLILPIAFEGINQDNATTNGLLARGMLIKAFEERSLNVLTSAMADGYGKQHGVVLSDPVTWTRDNFVAIGKQFKPTLIASIKLVKIESKEGNVGNSNGIIAPGSQLTTTASFEVNLFDVRSGKYILEKSQVSHQRVAGRPGPSDKQIVGEQNTAILEGAAKGFEGFLKKRPLVKPKGKSPRPDSSGG
ncbi:MAG: hypothetical protein ABL962_05805 [Fimbriimonadaceae bacterium]